jgi:methylthioribose-1-phosphate isomerase
MKLRHSPLFEPVQWEGSGFKILNEIALPERIEYIAVRELVQALDAVQGMKTRAFGQVLTFVYSGALIAQQFAGDDPAGLGDRLGRMTEQFCAARPTFDFRGLSDFFRPWLSACPPNVKLGEWVCAQARARAAEIVQARERRAKNAAAVLPHGARVLTHCNVSGELVAVAQFCHAMEKQFSVVATETRPYLQGARLTAWELAQAGVAVSLIPDCAVAQVMARGAVNAVLVGADRCAQNGDIINKVGTYPIAVVAQDYEIPFYVLAQAPRSLVRGADVVIEERPADELLTFHGHSLIGECHGPLAVRYPAFDVTPAALVTNFIGFDDVFTPASFRERFLTGASAAPEDNRQRRENYILIFGVPDGEGYDFLAEALASKSAARILVPEMRPALDGIRIARELLRRDLPVTIISDNMTGMLFAQGEIQRVCIFYSRLEEDGPRASCGALLTARLARAHDVLVELRPSGAAFESPADRDVATFLGSRIAPAGASIHALETEVVPWALIDRRGGSS